MEGVTVQALIACGRKLGITERILPGRDRRPVAGPVLIHPFREGERPSGQSVVILPPETVTGPASLPPLSPACAAASEQDRVPDSLRQFSLSTGTPVFASRFNAFLLQSRIIGLLREKGEGRITVHAVLVAVEGRGVLITGESGSGKTAAGLALVASGACWVADDAVVLERRESHLLGRGHERTGHLIAIRGEGIVRADRRCGAGALMVAAPVDLVVVLGRKPVPEGRCRWRAYLGIRVPCRRLEPGTGPDAMARRILAHLAEVTAAVRPIGAGGQAAHPAGPTEGAPGTTGGRKWASSSGW